MILFFLLIGCSEKPFVFKRKPNQCRQLSSLHKKEERGVLTEVELEYKWSETEAGTRLDFQAIGNDGQIKNNHRIYNKQGFVVEEYKENYQQHQETTEYDCSEEYCWRKKHHQEITTGRLKTILDVEYDWDGRRENSKAVMEMDGLPDKGEMKGYTIYNDYGESTKEFFRFEISYDQGHQIANSEYDCSGGWCKILSKEEKHVLKARSPFNHSISNLKETRRALASWWNSEDTTTEDISEYDWDENKQEWKTSVSNHYQIYNDYGYVIESYDEGINFKTWITNTYDCRDKE